MGTLYYGDNLEILRNQIASESVDLVYLDPPFNSNANDRDIFRVQRCLTPGPLSSSIGQ